MKTSDIRKIFRMNSRWAEERNKKKKEMATEKERMVRKNDRKKKKWKKWVKFKKRIKMKKVQLLTEVRKEESLTFLSLFQIWLKFLFMFCLCYRMCKIFLMFLMKCCCYCCCCYCCWWWWWWWYCQAINLLTLLTLVTGEFYWTPDKKKRVKR